MCSRLSLCDHVASCVDRSIVVVVVVIVVVLCGCVYKNQTGIICQRVTAGVRRGVAQPPARSEPSAGCEPSNVANESSLIVDIIHLHQSLV